MDTTPFNELTYRIIGAAMKVHNGLGPGLKEAFYQRALSLEMEKAGLGFSAEHVVEVHLDEAQVGLLYLDHLVEGEVVVEEKALPHMITDEEKAQLITYLAATGKKVGLLINFGRGSLEYKRILPPKNVTAWSKRIKRYVWVPRQQKFDKSVAQPPSAYPPSNPLTANPLSGSTPLPGNTPRP
jgi:GxxExxY protein